MNKLNVNTDGGASPRDGGSPRYALLLSPTGLAPLRPTSTYVVLAFAAGALLGGAWKWGGGGDGGGLSTTRNDKGGPRTRWNGAPLPRASADDAGGSYLRGSDADATTPLSIAWLMSFPVRPPRARASRHMAPARALSPRPSAPRRSELGHVVHELPGARGHGDEHGQQLRRGKLGTGRDQRPRVRRQSRRALLDRSGQSEARQAPERLRPDEDALRRPLRSVSHRQLRREPPDLLSVRFLSRRVRCAVEVARRRFRTALSAVDAPLAMATCAVDVTIAAACGLVHRGRDHGHGLVHRERGHGRGLVHRGCALGCGLVRRGHDRGRGLVRRGHM